MCLKVLLLATVVACAKAGFLGAPAVAYSSSPALTYSASPAVSHISYSSPTIYSTQLATPSISSQSSNIHNYGNLGQVSTQTKSIDTPFSSVRKSDIRVHNNGLQITAAAPVAYASPAAQLTAYHAPGLATYHAGHLGAPHALVGPAAIGVAYSSAPAVSHVTYQGVAASYGW